MKARFALTLFATLVLGPQLLSPAHAQSSYNFKDLGALSGPSGHSEAWGINDSGHAVGLSDGQAFYWNGTTIQGCGRLQPGDIQSWAYSLNNSDEVVGSSGNQVDRAFLWCASVPVWNISLPAQTMIDLNSLLSAADQSAWTLTEAYAINNNHQVAGNGLSNGIQHGFLLNLPTGTLTDLGPASLGAGTAGGSADAINDNLSPSVLVRYQNNSYIYQQGVYTLVPQMWANGINNAVEVVGSAAFNNSQAAYYWNGVSTSPQNIGSSWYWSLATAINNPGVFSKAVVVGIFRKTSLAQDTAFRWRVGSSKAEDLNALTSGQGKLVLIRARSVSDAGYIAGEDWDKAKSIQHAFVLTPVP